MMINKSRARIKYERRTKTLIASLKARQISRRECIGELDAAFERFLVPSTARDGMPFVVGPTVGWREWPSAGQAVVQLVDAHDELYAVRALALDNNNAVMEEMATRPIHLMPKNASAETQV